MIEHIHPEGEPTPTLYDLYQRREGLVEVVTWSSDKKNPLPTKYRVTDKGHRYLGEIMRRNALGSYIRGTAEEEAVEALKKVADEPAPEKKTTKSRKANWTES